jgi:holo-[acyl-carrier protein] synthase
MISGIGVDMVDVATLAETIKEAGDAYINRVFTPSEIEYCEQVNDSMGCYAARFAAKEAAMKALGTGWDQGVDWHDFEIVNEPSGRPTMRVRGKAEELLRERSVSTVWISLSHESGFAIAQVVFEQKDQDGV